GRNLAGLRQIRERGVEARELGTDTLVQPQALLGRRDVTGGALEQLEAESVLERRDRATRGRAWNAEPGCGGREALGLVHRSERTYEVEIDWCRHGILGCSLAYCRSAAAAASWPI